MIKKLTKHGNSMALVIDKPILESLDISPDTPIQMVIAGDNLVISRADVGLHTEELHKATRWVRQHYGEALKRLAD